MVYNMSNITGSVNILELYAGVGVLSNGMLVYGSLLCIWLVLFMVLIRRNPPAESILASSIVCSTLSLLFMAADLLPRVWFIGFVLVAALAAVSLYINRQ